MEKLSESAKKYELRSSIISYKNPIIFYVVLILVVIAISYKKIDEGMTIFYSFILVGLLVLAFKGLFNRKPKIIIDNSGINVINSNLKIPLEEIQEGFVERYRPKGSISGRDRLRDVLKLNTVNGTKIIDITTLAFKPKELSNFINNLSGRTIMQERDYLQSEVTQIIKDTGKTESVSKEFTDYRQKITVFNEVAGFLSIAALVFTYILSGLTPLIIAFIVVIALFIYYPMSKEKKLKNKILSMGINQDQYADLDELYSESNRIYFGSMKVNKYIFALLAISIVIYLVYYFSGYYDIK